MTRGIKVWRMRIEVCMFDTKGCVDLTRRCEMIRFEAHGNRAFVLHGALSREECAGYIEQAEGIGFYEAPVNGRLGEQRMEAVRNNDRVMVDDVDAAHALWARIIDHLSPVWREVPGLLAGEAGGVLAPVGLNERLRIYRYQPGQYFKPHRDGRFVRDSGELSLLTALFFLNDVTQGGQTRIWDGKAQFDIAPTAGSVLIFDHSLLHEGRTLEGGVKYVLRSDVMYRSRRRDGS